MAADDRYFYVGEVSLAGVPDGYYRTGTYITISVPGTYGANGSGARKAHETALTRDFDTTELAGGGRITVPFVSVFGRPSIGELLEDPHDFDGPATIRPFGTETPSGFSSETATHAVQVEAVQADLVICPVGAYPFPSATWDSANGFVGPYHAQFVALDVIRTVWNRQPNPRPDQMAATWSLHRPALYTFAVSSATVAEVHEPLEGISFWYNGAQREVGPAQCIDLVVTSTTPGEALTLVAPSLGRTTRGVVVRPAQVSLGAGAVPDVINLVGASASDACDTVSLSFDRDVDPTSASDPAHYTLSGGGAVSGIAGASYTNVYLSVDPPLAFDTEYTVTVEGVGGAGGELLGVSSLAFRTPVYVPRFDLESASPSDPATGIVAVHFEVDLEPGQASVPGNFSLFWIDGNGFNFAAALEVLEVTGPDVTLRFAPLLPDTDYSITVSSLVVGAGGEQLQQGTAQFHTDAGGPPPVTPPAVVRPRNTLRDFRRMAIDISPPFLVREVGARLVGFLGLAFDAVAEAAVHAVHSRYMPSPYFAVDGLAHLASERMLPRYPGESRSAHFRRVLDAWRIWSSTGTEPGLIEQAQAAFPDLAFAFIPARFYPEHANHWSRAILLVDGRPRWRPRGAWGDGRVWADGGTWGSTASVAEVEALRAIVEQHRPAEWLVSIVVQVRDDDEGASPSDTWLSPSERSDVYVYWTD